MRGGPAAISEINRRFIRKATGRFRNAIVALAALSYLFMAGGCVTVLPDAKSMLSDLRSEEASAVPGAASANGKTLVLREQHTQTADLLDRHIAAMDLINHNPLVRGNRVTLLIDGPAVYAAAVTAIQDARDNINFESYIINDDKTGEKLADLLLRKQSEGVQVSVIYDSFGSFLTPGAFFQRLRDGGINVLEFNPLNPFRSTGGWPIYRDHRKTLIVDGKTVITGGVNISGKFLRPPKKKKGQEVGEVWRDTDVLIEGPVAAQFQRIFIDTWQRQKGPELPRRNYFPQIEEAGDDLVRVVNNTPGSMNRMVFITYVSAFANAQRSIHITNAYFVPDEQIIEALIDAAKRGVDVKIILPGTSDFNVIFYGGRYLYTRLLEGGVRLYERQKVILHAKTAVVDGVWSTVGSTNMDFWSFGHNDDENAVILGRDFASRMEAVFQKDLSESKEITLNKWRERPLFTKLREWFVHLFAPLL